MASVNDRLARLEARRAPPPHETPHLLNLLIKEMDAERLELDGRPPDPGNEPTPEELEAGREGEMWFLETGGPQMRASSPHNPAALENIAQMEEQARQEIETKGSSA